LINCSCNLVFYKSQFYTASVFQQFFGQQFFRHISQSFKFRSRPLSVREHRYVEYSQACARPKRNKKLHEQFGDRLLCVRYRHDDQLRKRFKTVELIVEETAWTPPARLFAANTIVGVRVELAEVELQRKVKQAGGK
jgi:hypothetical protein